jgi:hypothetical protein
MSCYVILLIFLHVTSYHVMSCHGMLYYVMSCHITLNQVIEIQNIQYHNIYYQIKRRMYVLHSNILDLVVSTVVEAVRACREA